MTENDIWIYRNERCKYYSWVTELYHEWVIEGRPLSGNTYYVCRKCGRRVFRG